MSYDEQQPDSLDSYVRETVESYRAKLLELGSRNPLIHFKHSDRSRSHLRIVNEIPEVLAAKLEASRELTFVSLPEPVWVPRDENEPVFQAALRKALRQDEDYRESIKSLGPNASDRQRNRLERKVRDRVRKELNRPPFEPTSDPKKRASELGINPEFELPRPTPVPARVATDLKIQTLFFREDLDRRLGALRDTARVLLNDAGVNALYCAFGFLEYYESSANEEKRIAPLVFYPVELDRVIEDGEYKYFLKPRNDEIEVNVALAELLRRELSLELPPWVEAEEGQSTLERYFAAVEAAIVNRSDWKLRRYVTVGLFTFSTLAMYKDLDPQRWAHVSPLEGHPILRTLVAGAEVHDTRFAEDYDIDRRGETDVLLITDADSSQHSAVVDVLEGKSCVIQGPPGTGKSQTITNIIAAALHRGKTVLFVAEKMAALEVVGKRLNKAGLQQFCLEVHSTKTSKTAVLESLSHRIEYEGPTQNLQRYQSNLEALERARRELIYYFQKANEFVGQTGLRIHEIFFGSAKRDSEKPRLPATLAASRFPEPLDLTEHQRVEMRAAAATLEKQTRLLSFGTLAEHPWRGLHNSGITEFETDAFVALLIHWSQSLRAVDSAVRSIEQATSTRFPRQINELESVCETVDGLRPAPLETVNFVFSRLGTLDRRKRLASVVADLRDILKHQQFLAGHAKNLSSLVAGGSERLTACIARLSRLGVANLSIRSLKDRLAESQRSSHDSARALLVTDALAESLDLGNVDVFQTRTIIAEIQHLQELAVDTLSMREPDVLEDTSAPILKRSTDVCEALKGQRSTLESRLDLTTLGGAGELRQLAHALSAANFVTALFNGECRKANQLFRMARRNPDWQASRTEIANEFMTCAQYLKEEAAFIGEQQVRQACGSYFRGLQTPFELLGQVNGWAKGVRARLSGLGEFGARLRAFLLSESREKLDNLLGCSRLEGYGALLRVLEAHTQSGFSLSDLIKHEQDYSEELTNALAWLSEAFPDSFSTGDLASVAEALERIEECTTRKREFVQEMNLPPGGIDESPEMIVALTSTLQQAEGIAGTPLPGGVISWLLGDLERLPTLKRLAIDLRSLVDEARYAGLSFGEAALLDFQAWCGRQSPNECELAELIARAERAVENTNFLTEYVSFLLEEESAARTGMAPVMAAYHAANTDYVELELAVDILFFRSAAERILNADPRLRQHSGATHEQLIKRYQQLDREFLELRRTSLASELATREIPTGVSVGRVGDLTELALVKHISGQTRPRLPLRELFRRAAQAIQAMKPCWMMSPMSVAQFLVPKAVEFDLVIMDEASQIRPEQALGSIVRGKQLVVVGDQMQLPPTSFFQKLSADSSDDDEDVVVDVKQESVLEAAASRFFPPRRLKWHYRSEHGSLISFSNREFYSDDLTVFPSPNHDHPEYGVKVEFIAGVYGAGINHSEAKAVVNRAADFMRLFPKQSLGIVAVNSKQADLIREMMDKVYASNAVAEAYRAKWEQVRDGLESVFIKNLENVQGDERDVIFISTVYGHDEQGNFHQRFGPINSEYGHRRLNVLFTRAKRRILVFTSMTPEEIQDEGKHRGVGILKAYLQYARDGHAYRPEGSREECDSEFEQWVLEMLRAHGFDSVPQLGFAGYRIDIAVRDPQRPGTFLCGIECDGAKYHSARSVRERDRIRQEILERLGWKIYRIWSTDWFRNPALQSRKLVDYLTALTKV